MRDRTAFLILATSAGILTLSFFAIIQRRILGWGFTTDPRAYIVPLIYGGTIGFWVGLRQLRIWENEEELQANRETVWQQSEELKETGEMLGRQIAEGHATQERLLLSEQRLREELLATEEMLRAQIIENENRRYLQRQ